jgi:hypothetical protein
VVFVQQESWKIFGKHDAGSRLRESVGGMLNAAAHAHEDEGMPPQPTVPYFIVLAVSSSRRLGSD